MALCYKWTCLQCKKSITKASNIKPDNKAGDPCLDAFGGLHYWANCVVTGKSNSLELNKASKINNKLKGGYIMKKSKRMNKENGNYVVQGALIGYAIGILGSILFMVSTASFGLYPTPILSALFGGLIYGLVLGVFPAILGALIGMGIRK